MKATLAIALSALFASSAPAESKAPEVGQTAGPPPSGHDTAEPKRPRVISSVAQPKPDATPVSRTKRRTELSPEARDVLVAIAADVTLAGRELVTQPAATATAAYDPKTLNEIVRQGDARVELCYSLALLNTPTLEGQVVAELKIDTQGSVSDAAIATSTVSNKDVVNCVKQVAKTLVFPKKDSGNPVKVTYSWRFEPEG